MWGLLLSYSEEYTSLSEWINLVLLFESSLYWEPLYFDFSLVSLDCARRIEHNPSKILNGELGVWSDHWTYDAYTENSYALYYFAVKSCVLYYFAIKSCVIYDGWV